MKWNELNVKGKVVVVIGGIIALLVMSGIIGLIIGIGFISPVRIIFGIIYVLFLPGFLLTFIFFPKNKDNIDWLERIALSFALSIAVVPLVIFYMNLIGVRISAVNSFFIILGIIALTITAIMIRSKTRKKNY